MGDPKTIRLTDAVVRKLTPADTRNGIAWDADFPGFACRVTAAGTKAFILNYRVKGSGRQRRQTIGRFPSWSTTVARAKARELRRLVDDGGDPRGDVEADRQAPTVADLCDRFVAEHLPRKRPGTALNYEILIDKHIRPALGRLKVTDVAFADIDRLHHAVSRKAPYAGNRTLAVLSRMFNLAIRWEMRPDNPTRGVERNNEIRRQRYLSGEELAALTSALATHPDRQATNIIRVLLLTGARRGEVFAMRWADIDLQHGAWSKPASSTKQAKAHEVPLSAPARQLLSEIAAKQRKPLDTFVFPGAGGTGHVVEIKRAWRTLCRSAGINGLRVHDLRHSFASQLASAGASLPLIGALLGHSNPTTTHRYSHLFQDPQRAAVEKVAAIIDAAGKDAKEPVSLKGGGHGR